MPPTEAIALVPFDPNLRRLEGKKGPVIPGGGVKAGGVNGRVVMVM